MWYLKDKCEADCESKIRFTQFHDWLMKTMNDDIPETICYTDNDIKDSKMQQEISGSKKVILIKMGVT